jgi:uncharacterized lipoprotein NlpE involved in copper resistance
MGSIFITFAVVINLIGCNDNITPKELSVLPTLLYLTAQGGEQPLNISVTWEITNIPSWISFSKTSGTGNKT